MNNVLPAGKWWIGDLCYVMHDEWNEVCDKLDFNGRNGAVHQLADGRKFGVAFTAHGDGTYSSNVGFTFGVDAGLIGCILVDDIKKTPSNDLSLGKVVEFTQPFTVSYTDKGGVIHIGHVEVYTDHWDDEEEYDEDLEDEDY